MSIVIAIYPDLLGAVELVLLFDKNWVIGRWQSSAKFGHGVLDASQIVKIAGVSPAGGCGQSVG